VSEQTQERGVALDQPVKRRSAAERFAGFHDRIARSLPTPVRTDTEEPVGEFDYSDDEQATSWYEVVPRFPLARSGYECAAVDEHIELLERELEELESELEQLRTRTPAHNEVEDEIRRIGEQTSTILLAAHDRAKETTQQAQEQADKCLADAAANAIRVTEEANHKKAEIEVEMRRLTTERSRLLADMEALAGTLSTVAREATGRFSESV
jgi:DNA repair exonuclease SbcCD ATPase subunit